MHNLMLKIRYYKEYQLDSCDPDGRVFKIAMRTAIACCLSIVIFQLIGQNKLSGWAAFAALGFSQIDSFDLIKKRLIYLISNIVIFSLLAIIGVILGPHTGWFIVSLAIVVFMCGYIAKFGTKYFNAGGWAAFLYVACGSSLGDKFYAFHLGLTFFAVGLLCLILSLLMSSENPEKKITQSLLRILYKLCWLNQYPHYKNTIIENQIEKLLTLNYHALHTYLPLLKAPDTDKYFKIFKVNQTLYQLLLMFKNVTIIHSNVSQYSTHPQTTINNCHYDTVELIDNLIAACKQAVRIEVINMDERIANYRNKIQQVQIVELKTDNPNLDSIIAYSNYLYHFIQIWDLIEDLKTQLRCIYSDNV